MDNNAQVPSVQNPPLPVRPVTGQVPPSPNPAQNTTAFKAPSLAGQTPVKTDPFTPVKNALGQTAPIGPSKLPPLQQVPKIGAMTGKSPFQPSAPPPMPKVPPVSQQNAHQPVSVSRFHEQGPIATIGMDEDDRDDRTPIASQEAAQKESPVVQMSQPEVVVQNELKQIGVTQGSDADKKQLPEEQVEQLGDVTDQDQKQETTTTQAKDIDLPMAYGEAKLAVKKERSIRKGISWIIRQVMRQWKKKLVNKDKQITQ